jgi:hypothetical protein
MDAAFTIASCDKGDDGVNIRREGPRCGSKEREREREREIIVASSKTDECERHVIADRRIAGRFNNEARYSLQGRTG